MSINTCSNHDDGNIAQFPNRATQLKTVDTREHDVNKHDIGRSALENRNCIFAGRSLIDDPAFVLEGKFDGGSDALVVLNG